MYKYTFSQVCSGYQFEIQKQWPQTIRKIASARKLFMPLKNTAYPTLRSAPQHWLYLPLPGHSSAEYSAWQVQLAAASRRCPDKMPEFAQPPVQRRRYLSAIRNYPILRQTPVFLPRPQLYHCTAALTAANLNLHHAKWINKRSRC